MKIATFNINNVNERLTNLLAGLNVTPIAGQTTRAISQGALNERVIKTARGGALGIKPVTLPEQLVHAG